MIKKVVKVRRCLTAAGALYLCLVQSPDARADFESCIAPVTAQRWKS